MKKNKFQKGKSLAIAVFGLAAVAVVGVGFSSWVINFNQKDTVEEVNLKVAEVEDRSVAILGAHCTGVSTDNTDKFVFDATSTQTTGILFHGANASGSGIAETTDANNLVYKFSFLLAYPSTKASGTTFDVKATMTVRSDVSETIENAYNLATKASSTTALTSNENALANGAGYLVAPLSETATDLVIGSEKISTNSPNKVTKGSSQGTIDDNTEHLSSEEKTTYAGWNYYSFEVESSFVWGATFDNDNPAVYFNKANNSNATHEKILDTLNQLHLLNGVKFDIELVPSLHA